MKEYPKLPPDFKKKWVKALRSKKYKQGRGLLYNQETNSYCCLGVACRVAGYEPSELQGADLVVNLPKVPRWLHSMYDSDTASNIVGSLVMMNDKEKKTFIQIANWVEKHL